MDIEKQFEKNKEKIFKTLRFQDLERKTRKFLKEFLKIGEPSETKRRGQTMFDYFGKSVWFNISIQVINETEGGKP